MIPTETLIASTRAGAGNLAIMVFETSDASMEDHDATGANWNGVRQILLLQPLILTSTTIKS